MADVDAGAMSDVEIMSSFDDELIADITRPSLISLSSYDSLNEEDFDVEEFTKGMVPPMLSTETNSSNEHCPSNDSAVGEKEFKVPPGYSSVKRHSISSVPINQCSYDVNKSTSMLDVSSLMSFIPLRRNSCMYSNETLQSTSVATTKSKDSGFQRSTSCTSLTTTGSKKYDHVQSKVKQYIRTIKQTEALRKVQKQIETNIYREALERSSLESPDISPLSIDVLISKKDLMNKVKELEEELKEKECFIEQLEKNQSELRLKYAAAENRIDDLRIRVGQNGDPSRDYMTDEKVTQLLMSSVDTSPGYSSSVTKNLFNTEKRERSNFNDIPKCSKPLSSANGQKENYGDYSSSPGCSIQRSQDNFKSSSCRYISPAKYELSKSASNIDRQARVYGDNNMVDLPYDKNSFAKVQQWQRSLVNLNKSNDEHSNVCCSAGDETACCLFGDSIHENQLKKLGRYQKNKDADKKRYRQSYPVGCKCEKFKKCKSKEELNLSTATQMTPFTSRKFRRTVSFADYEDTTTSSLYDYGDSSSDVSDEVMLPKHESYKMYKQRKLHEKFVKYEDSDDKGLKWNEVKKAKSAGNIYRNKMVPQNTTGNKRVTDGYEQSCNDRRHCSKVHSIKYRKLDEHSKVASSSSCQPLVKCKSISAHVCRSSKVGELDGRGQLGKCLLCSKSLDQCSPRSMAKDCGHRLDKLDCSCLLALENLKLQEHHILTKLSEHTRKQPRRLKDLEGHKLCPHRD